jgi:hypothetical protein
MKLGRLLVALTVALFLAGCAPVDSLNPLYTDDDLAFDQELLGQWNNESGGLLFAQTGNGYRIFSSAQEDNTVTMYDAHLVQLGGRRFLDVQWTLTPFDESKLLAEVQVTHGKDGLKIQPRLVRAGLGAYWELVPGESDRKAHHFSMVPRLAHQFFKVVLDDQGRTLRLTPLDDEWVEKQIEEGKLIIDHESIAGSPVVLTASTEQLQQLVLDHVDDQKAFHDEMVVHR